MKKENLNVVYGVIQNFYYDLKSSIKNGASLEVQNMNRGLLNSAIRDYMVNGGKRNVEKYCEFYA